MGVGWRGYGGCEKYGGRDENVRGKPQKKMRLLNMEVSHVRKQVAARLGFGRSGFENSQRA